MKTATLLLGASAALATAQVTWNETTHTYTCAKPGVAYCAGDSLKTDIIIRCDANGVGRPGRCSDNLAGEPPVGVKPALCWQTSTISGDAACEKNCVVYGGSGNANGTFTLPADQCTPDTPTSTSGSTTRYPTSTLITVTYTSGTSVCTTSTTPIPPPPPMSTGTGSGGSGGHGNGTCTACGGNGGGSGGSATHTPVQPTKTASPTQLPTAGAALNRAGGALAAVGLFAAYML